MKHTGVKSDGGTMFCRLLAPTATVENGGDIAFLAELFTGKPKGWSELVTVKTCLDIVERGEALNRSPLPGSAEPGPIVQFIQTQERRRAALDQLQASTKKP